MAKKKTKKIIAKKDIVIPKGTIFENIDMVKREYYFNNYETTIEINEDNTASFVVVYDEATIDDEHFEYL